MRKLRLMTMALMVGAAWLLQAAPASAAPTAFGIRGGGTFDSDAIFIGGHLVIAPSGAQNLLIRPSLDIGVGDDDYYYDDDFFFLRGNFHLLYMIPLSGDLAFYPVFGLSLHHMEWEDGYDHTGFGVDLGLGLEINAFGIELAFGLPRDELPDITLAISYTFW